jgi:hypothetical protein
MRSGHLTSHVLRRHWNKRLIVVSYSRLSKVTHAKRDLAKTASIYTALGISVFT